MSLKDTFQHSIRVAGNKASVLLYPAVAVALVLRVLLDPAKGGAYVLDAFLDKIAPDLLAGGLGDMVNKIKEKGHFNEADLLRMQATVENVFSTHGAELEVLLSNQEEYEAMITEVLSREDLIVQVLDSHTDEVVEVLTMLDDKLDSLKEDVHDGFRQMHERFDELQEPKEEELPDPDEVGEHEILVLFAQFKQLEGTKSNPGELWPYVLRNEITQLITDQGIAFLELPRVVTSKEEANELLEAYEGNGAKIIIWGAIADFMVEVNYSFNLEIGTSGLPTRYLRTSDARDLQRGHVEPQVLISYVRSGGDSEYHLNLLIGILEHKQKNYEEAIPFLTHCVDMFPFETLGAELANEYFGNLIGFRGCTYAVCDNLDSAFFDLSSATEHNPNASAYWSNLGMVKGQLGDLKGAIADLDRAIELNPNHSAPWNNRGTANREIGNYHGSMNDYSQAIKLEPDRPNLWNNRGATKVYFGNDNEAISDFDRAILLDPDDPQYWENRGLAKANLGFYKDAIVDLTESIRLGPGRPDPYSFRSQCHKALGDQIRSKNDMGMFRKLSRKSQPNED